MRFIPLPTLRELPELVVGKEEGAKKGKEEGMVEIEGLFTVVFHGTDPTFAKKAYYSRQGAILKSRMLIAGGFI